MLLLLKILKIIFIFSSECILWDFCGKRNVYGVEEQQFNYDALHQLTAVKNEGGHRRQYYYNDSTGNRGRAL
ncbi:hypothetical protein HUG15_20095 [Salicibibacter cibarius]|uniref:RHS repeat-associated core domain-containing protein n=2 Tax=Salicibibacter cibarius TaxID=2743000 RepID=A0A7T6Z668_9BACI|nr:hypothetical protein [Salicibibacter cibarius]QQK77656.1 hypothetical protein HUG15_20095 [Salicibibacter cibarius]